MPSDFCLVLNQWHVLCSFIAFLFLYFAVTSETCSLTLEEEHGLRVFTDTVLRIFRLRREEVTGGCRNYIMRSFITCTRQGG